ncbi:MAG: VOC family protein [Thermoleophilia bacterium]|nr:VOC family protein [Thermoleophilia bacterium]
MTATLGSVIYPAADMEAAKAAFGAVLGAPAVDEPYYVGFDVGGVQVGLDPNGASKGMTGPVAYFDVDDLDAAVGDLEAAGATVTAPPSEVGGGARIATLSLPSGDTVGLRGS